MSSESPKKIMYPTTSLGKGHSHHMPKNPSSSLPKVHANQNSPNYSQNSHSQINPHQYYSLRWNNYQK